VDWIAGLFYGIKPAVTAIVLQAAHRMGTRSLKHSALWAIAATSFVAMAVFNVPFPAIVIAAASCGWLISRVRPDVFQAAQGHGAAPITPRAALIDDDTPRQAHTHFSARRLTLVMVTGCILWALPMGALVLVWGWDHTLAQMGWFFTKAALLTFGGAYAVLPYVYQGGVEQFQWLTAQQMIDGLALGETTPGPLIMVVTFIGFVGGWTKQLFGPDNLVQAGIVAGSVVTYFTFLPSFIMIFLGAPIIESTHGNLKFTAPLTGITAAVVGVILSLAVFFAHHVLWPAGFSGAFEWFSALLGIAAFIALWRYKIGIIPVIAACGTIGLFVSVAGLHRL
jgi:chromate transporter